MALSPKTERLGDGNNFLMHSCSFAVIVLVLAVTENGGNLQLDPKEDSIS